jgi:hypothetical protein
VHVKPVRRPGLGVEARVVDLVEEVLERAGHIADVRRRAEHERVRGEHVNSGRGQGGGDHDVDPRLGEIRVTGAGHDRLEHRPQRGRRRVVDNEQPRHQRTSSN